MKKIFCLLGVGIALSWQVAFSQSGAAHNPVIYADVPDMSMVRVGDTYYMSSTAMHLSPGLPIMKSKDLINWEVASYCYNSLGDLDELKLNNGKNIYGGGTWASSIRYHEGVFYVTTFSYSTGKTHVYRTRDIEKGNWEATSFSPACHDHSLFFDEGRIYLIWGGGRLNIAELNEDMSGLKEGTERVLIENATAPVGVKEGMPAEGSQLFKINGKYYLVNICWPVGGMRTVLVHRADNLNGPWEGKVMLQDRGIAQGGLVDTPQGEWYAYLFRDNGSVGRIPYWAPVQWVDGWPVMGIDGKVPDTLNRPVQKSGIPGIVSSDEFSRKKNDAALPLVWQWNHEPDNTLWSVSGRKGYLRLKTGRIDTDFLQARNTLTQRTFGPICSGITAIDVSQMKEGDCAGLALLQKKYGWVGVKYENGSKKIVMVSAQNDKPEEVESLPLSQKKLFLKASCDYTDSKDIADFYYSLNGKDWKKIGNQLRMEYSIPHFMGYRFGLFNYASQQAGGYVDFDYFRVSDKKLK
jgi:beta-xylosidase